MGHKHLFSVEYILENRLRMAVLNGMVFALMYLTKATTIFMSMRCNKVLLMQFGRCCCFCNFFNFQITIQTTQFRNHKTEWGWSEELQSSHFLVLLVSEKIDLGLKK